MAGGVDDPLGVAPALLPELELEGLAHLGEASGPMLPAEYGRIGRRHPRLGADASRGRRSRTQLAADRVSHERGDGGSIVSRRVHRALELAQQAGAREELHRVAQLLERWFHLSDSRIDDGAQGQRLLVAGTLRKELVELPARRLRVVLPKLHPGQCEPGCRIAAHADCLLQHRRGIGDAPLLCQQPRQRVHDRRILSDGRDPSPRGFDAGVDTARASRAPDKQRPCGGVPGSSRDRRLGVDQSTVVAAQAKADVTPESTRVRALRVRGNGAVQRCLRQREEPRPERQVGEANPSPRILGVHLGEGLELEEGHVPVAEVELGDCELVPWPGCVGHQSERSAEVSPRRIELVRGQVGLGTPDEARRAVLGHEP